MKKTLEQIVKYEYTCYGHPHIFLSYDQGKGMWKVIFRNPIDFCNSDFEGSKDVDQACINALEFVGNNQEYFSIKVD